MNTALRADARLAPPSRWVLVAVCLLTLLAGALRLHTASATPGLYRDEAYNGLDALRVLAGDRPIFFPANNGREPLFIYLCAASVALLGRSPGALRLVAALASTAFVPALYWLGREWFGRRIGLWAAALAVTSVWLLSLSGVALRAGLLPLLSALGLAAFWRGQRLHSLRWMLLGGALLGLSFYTYLAARFVPLALGLAAAWCAVTDREAIWWRGWLAVAIVGLLVSAPLSIYLLRHGELLGRAEQVSVLNPAIHGGDAWGALARNVGRALRMFAYGGDFIPRHNAPWRPVFTPPLAAAYYGGLGLAAARARREPAARLALAWLVTMLLPTILAENAPHFLRAVGVLPVTFVLPALALDWLASRPAGPLRIACLALSILAVLSGAAWDLRDHKRRLASESVYYQFESGAVQMAVEINAHLGAGWQGHGIRVTQSQPKPGHGVWLAPRLWEQWPSVRYLVEREDLVRRLETDKPIPDSAPDELLVILWPFEDHGDVWAGLPLNGAWEVSPGAWERGDLEPEARLLYVRLRGSPAGALASAQGATWEGGLALVQAQVESLGHDAVAVHLAWRADAPPSEDLSAFRHVLCDGVLAGQSDGSPGQDIWPVHSWRAGDVVWDRRVIALKRPWDRDRCQVQVGLYRWQDLTRLRLRDPAGQPMIDEAVILTGR